jgi:DNA polymerase IIIc chi subunit
MEANIYQVDSIDSLTIAPLLFKFLEQQKKAIIYCHDIEIIKKLDNSLWSYGRNKFLPHITIFDKDFDMKRQNIILSNEEINPNNAQYIILLDRASPQFLKQFSRIFCFNLINDNGKFLSFKKDFQDNLFTIKSYKKDGNKWISNS